MLERVKKPEEFQSESEKYSIYLAVSWLCSPILFTFLQHEKAYHDDFSEREGLWICFGHR